MFWVWLDDFTNIGRLYGGQKKGQSLYYFNPHMSFWSRIRNRQIISRINIKTRSSTEGVNMALQRFIEPVDKSKQCGSYYQSYSGALNRMVLWNVSWTAPHHRSRRRVGWSQVSAVSLRLVFSLTCAILSSPLRPITLVSLSRMLPNLLIRYLLLWESDVPSSHCYTHSEWL